MSQLPDQTGRHRLPETDRTGDLVGDQIDPTDIPMVSSVSDGLTPDKASRAVSRSFTATSASGSQAAPKARIGKRSLAQLATELGERDHLILDAVAEHRFLTTAQLTDLLFADLSPISQRRIAQRVLARLRSSGLLDALPRHVGGVAAGSAGLVHHLTEAGQRLVELDSGQQRRRRWHEPSDRFAEHHLAVADVRVALELAHRANQLELVRHQVEPTTWRQYDSPRGTRSMLKPDLYVETATEPDSAYVDAWFIEVDLGNETIPTLIRKCHGYQQYRRQGTEQQRGGFPWVLWLLHAKTTERLRRRQAALAAALAADKSLPASLFQIITPDQLIPTITKGAAL